MKALTRRAQSARSRSMAERPAAIRVTCRFSAPPERVFKAWLDRESAGTWLFATASRPMTHVELDARAGGSFSFADYRQGEYIAYTGEYIEIAPHRRLVFTLSMEDRPHVITRVTVAITALNTGCELALTHENVPPDRENQTEARWTGILYGLGVTLNSRSGARDSSRRRSRRQPVDLGPPLNG
jgi:uncharacterized protein YndB with AHSA1/START domain